MSASVVGYVLTAKEFPFGLSQQTAFISGGLVALGILFYLIRVATNRKVTCN